MTTNRPEFAAHDDFIFEHKEIGKVTREEFIKYIRSSHEHMRKLSELIQQYNQTIDVYLEEWDGKFESFDDDVKDLLGRWINDGTMDHIINENLMSIKADKTYVDDLNENVTAQLAQTNWNTFKQSAVNHSKIEPTIVWIDDDGDRGFYETIKPILEKYNIVATSAIITGANHGFPIDIPKTIDGESFVETTDPMDWEQIKELRDSGLAEFVSHTHSNIDLRDHTDEENYEDLKKSQKVLRELGLSPEHFVYPYGAVDSRTEAVVRQLFKSGFSTRSGIVSFPMNQFAIQRFSIGDSTTLAQINQKTDEALAGGELVVWVSHVRSFDKPKVEGAIEYALSKGFKFKTVTEAINEFGNILDFDDTKIGANGQVRSRILGSYRYTGIDEHINNSTRSELRPVNTTILGRLRTAEANDSNLTAESFAENFPLGHYWTYIDTMDNYNFQRALNLNETIESIRQVNGDTGEWGAWKDVGRVEYLRSLPEGRKPNEYSRNKITIENIGLTNISAYNVPSTGILVTIDHRLGAGGTFRPTQEFIPIFSDGKVRPRMYRIATGAEYWDSWETNQQTKYVSRNRTWSSMEIQPKHTRKFVTAGERYTTDLGVETVIKNDLPIGLIVQSVIIENGQIETRVTNVRDTVITTDIVVDLIVKAY